MELESVIVGDAEILGGRALFPGKSSTGRCPD